MILAVPACNPIRWAILTGEYAPDPGGVSDYTRLIARGLVAAGDEVRVFAPPRKRGVEHDDAGVAVHRLPGRYGPRSLAVLEGLLNQRPRPDRVLIQYVPHSYGCKAMNVPFALWSATRLRRVAPVWVMFHEVAFPFRWKPVSHAVIGTTTRIMARWVAGAADRIFVSIPAWAPLLRELCPRAKPAEWLPVPCNLETAVDPAMVADARARYARANGPLLGHFGTFGPAVTSLLEPALAEVLHRVPAASAVLAGRGSEKFCHRFCRGHVEFSQRVQATGELAARDIAAHLRSCDLLLQPYPDGISTRRGSAMAGLANGVPIVTNLGALSEPLWGGGAVAAASGPHFSELANLTSALLVDPETRAGYGQRGLALYRDRFAPEHSVAKLRETQ